MHKQRIQHIHLAAVLNIYSTLFLCVVSQQVSTNVCLHSYLSIHRVHLLMYLHVYEVASAVISHMVCVQRSVLAFMGNLGTCWHSYFPSESGKRVALGGGDGYTGGTLSAATQTQAGSIPAVKRGLYLCMCLTPKGREAQERYSQVLRFRLQGEG